MKITKRILSLLLILSLVLPLFPSMQLEALGGAATVVNRPVTSPDDFGSAGYGWIIGFGICDMEEYTGDGSDDQALLDWIEEYSKKYYVNVVGDFYYLPGSGSIPTSFPGYNNCLSTGGDPAGFLNAVKEGSTPDYAYRTETGRLAVQPERTGEVVSMIKDANPALADQWTKTRLAGKHPIVITVEAVGVFKDVDGELFGTTVYNFGQTLNLDVTAINYPASIVAIPFVDRSGGLSSHHSYTARVITDGVLGLVGNVQSDTYIVTKMLKGMFGINSKNAQPYAGEDAGGFYGRADAVAQGIDESITGCYIISINGSSGTPDEPGPDLLSGAYQWDLNSTEIPVNNRGYLEDGTAVIAKGGSVNGAFDLGHIKLDTSYYSMWNAYKNRFGIDTVDLEFVVYGLGTGNGLKDYNTTRSAITGNSSANGITPNVCNTYSKNGVTGDEFIGWLRDGGLGKVVLDGMNGSAIETTISATSTNNMVAVAYVTELYVTPHGSGTMDGQKIRFSNNQVHFAVYTFKDEERTYHLEFKDIEGWSQLKTNAIASAQFEAQTGTPTTEDMFISMGGSEFVVNMQYRYVQDDYYRKYQLKAEPYDNYMYYEAGDSWEKDFTTKVYSEVGTFQGSSTTQPELNFVFDDNKADATSNQASTFRRAVEGFFKEIQNLFDTIDDNSNSSGGVYDTDDYAVVVPKGALKIDMSTGVITGLDKIEGNNDYGLKSKTIQALRDLSVKTQKLAKIKSLSDSAFGTYNFAEAYNDFIDSEIVFIHTTKGLDYDSDAYGGVSVTFSFDADYAKYTELAQTYALWHECKASSKSWSYSCATCGTSGSGTASHASHSPSDPICKDYETVKIDTTWDTPEYDCGGNKTACTAINNDPSHVCTDACAAHDPTGTTGATYTCDNPTHTHYGHNAAVYDGPNTGHENPFPISNLCSGYSNETADEYWAAHFKAGVERNYSYNSQYDFARESDGDRGKKLEQFSEFYQVYKDVKYMDIIDCHVWRLAGGVVDYNLNAGLSGLIAPTELYAPVIELACANEGYTLYNVEADNVKGYWDGDFEGDFGEGGQVTGAWRAVSEEFAGEIVDEADAELGFNNELQTIGRLANSYHAGSQNEDAPADLAVGGRIGDPEHGLMLYDGEDTVLWVYIIEEQGGRSHHSFDGFLKQALALATYKQEDPVGNVLPAYRNYIQVQSDYLSLGNAAEVTLSGFHWASEEWKRDGSEKKDAAYGLTQAILSTQADSEASGIYNYVKMEGEFWKKADDLDEVNINVASVGLNGTDILDKQMRGPSADKSAPTEHIKDLIAYAEGGGDGNVDGKGAAGVVRLEQFDVYKTWDIDTVNGSLINTQYARNANFKTEDKQERNTMPTKFPIVGYVGAEDSVLENLHQYSVMYPMTTQYVGSETLVNGGVGGLSFDVYGATQHLDKLVIDRGTIGATNRIVSGGSPKNVVRNWGGMFPYITGLNVIRWIPNGVKGGYSTALVYDECLHFNEAYPGVLSSEYEMLNKAEFSTESFSSKEKEIVSDLHVENTYDQIFGDADDVTGSSGSGFVTDVGYGGSSDTKTNPITIFNPSTTENVKVLESPDTLPDGQNKYRDVTEDETIGYVIRDQRVATEVAVSEGSGETYVSYKDLNAEDLQVNKGEKIAVLLEKTLYKGGITDFYTIDDYTSNEVEYKYLEVSPADGPVDVTTSGDYTLSIVSATGYDTTVKVNLEQGDKVYTDGTSIYVEEVNSAPTVTWDDLSRAVANYYETTDDVTLALEAKLRTDFANTIVSSVKGNLNTIRDYMEVFDTTDIDDTYLYHLETLIKEYNTVLSILSANYTLVNGNIHFEYAGEYDLINQIIFELQNAYDLLKNLTFLGNPVSTIYTIDNVPTLSYEAMVGKAATFKLDDRFLVEDGAVMIIDFTGLGMSAGSVLSVELPFNANYANPADVTLTTDGTIGKDYEVYVKQEGNVYTWVIEAISDIELGKATFVFNHDMYIQRFTGSCVQFEKVWICDVGTSQQDKVYPGTTIQHEWNSSADIYWNKSTRTESVNKYVVDVEVVWNYTQITRRTGHLYLVEEARQRYTLSDEALSNPHKVYNANWRYYVVGWKTDNGVSISSPNDPLLFNDATVLCWPAEISGTITVGELKDTACLVVFRGVPYLTTKEAGYQVKHDVNGNKTVVRKILETGTEVSTYDMWTLGELGLPTLTLDKATSDVYPLLPNQPAKDLTSDTYAYQSHNYEFFFSLLDYDAALFNVEYSKNLLYRFASEDFSTVYNPNGNNLLDYEFKESVNSGNVIVVPGQEATNLTAEYISLDDEFSIYFDNVGTFCDHPEWYNSVGDHNTGTLGYGWNANGIKLLGDAEDGSGIASWYGSDISNTQTVVDGKLVDRQTTETTGWIYAKYVIFNTDVYVFSDDGGATYNPTLNAYASDGTARTPVLIEAGTPVYLGYYNDALDWLDNTGAFTDYGAPNLTKDNMQRAWVYNFWLPLSAGESKESMVIEYRVVNINDDGQGFSYTTQDAPPKNNYLSNTHSYVDTPVENDLQGITEDPGYGVNARKTSVVGRIGALTIVDTGDPRYSDSFKVTNFENDEVSNFLIYPVVRRIYEYTNKFTGKYTALEGSQRAIVLDPFDVRGRIAEDWMVTAVKQKHADSSYDVERDTSLVCDWSDVSYNLYGVSSYNTYTTQWFKESLTRWIYGTSTEDVSKQYAVELPLGSNFNKHETFQNSPLKVGYELYLSLEAIGNYVSYSTAGGIDVGDAVNGNNDYGTNKVQIRPFYSAVDAVRADGTFYEGPVDVYMRSGDSYVLINSGCDRTTSGEINCTCPDESHSISEVLSVMWNNYLPSYIETNTGDIVYDENGTAVTFELDENTQRRMVTDMEAAITRSVLNRTGSMSILTKLNKSTAGIGGEELEIKYSYGNSQMLFLRERNMTFVGGKTAALNWNNEVSSSMEHNTKYHAQKYYFGLGLPSSAVFVPHGLELTMDTVLKTGYVVNSIDVIAIGGVWTLHYESEVSKMTFNYEEGELHWKEWNPYYKKYPWLIPVTYYNIEDTALSDMDTEGSH